MSDSIREITSTSLLSRRAERQRRATHALAATVALIVGTGPAVSAQTPTSRKFVDRNWVALWHTSGDPDDALFGLPREIVASEAGVFVLDVGTRQLSAFGRDARKRWTIGKHGRGPGEFLRPVDLALLPNGEIGVLDPDNGRVSIFAASGKFRTTVATTAAAISSSLCATGDGHLHFLSSATDAFVLSVDTAGKPARLMEFPWPLQANTPRLVKSASFARGRAGARSARSPHHSDSAWRRCARMSRCARDRSSRVCCCQESNRSRAARTRSKPSPRGRTHPGGRSTGATRCS